MPAYDYHCDKCGKTEEYFFKPMPPERLLCAFPGCGGEAYYAPSFYYTSQTAQRFAPVVIHKDSEGNVRFPAHADAPLPPGFQKVELTNFNEIRRFEKEVNTKDREEASKFHNAKAELLSGQLKENRRVMERIVEGFSPAGKKFYEKMQQVSKAKERNAGRPIDPGFYIEAFTQDSSNRQGYRDAKNDWGKHHGSGK